MKLKKFSAKLLFCRFIITFKFVNLSTYIFFTFYFQQSFSAEKKSKVDLLYGSVVKSESWEIDRINDLEKFKGNVSFRNRDYKMSSEYATYYHKDKIWDIGGKIYCLRNFENNLKLEAFCDFARYFEDIQRVDLYSDKDKYVRIIYYGENDKKLTCVSKKVVADNKSEIMEFVDDFAVYADSAAIRGEKAIYEHKNREFVITGKRPIAQASHLDYQAYIEGSYIKLNKDNMLVSIYGDVKGLVISPDIESKMRIK